jgi:hypothetical protein
MRDLKEAPAHLVDLGVRTSNNPSCLRKQASSDFQVFEEQRHCSQLALG